MPQDNYYECQLETDLFLYMVPITHDNQDFWYWYWASCLKKYFFDPNAKIELSTSQRIYESFDISYMLDLEKICQKYLITDKLAKIFKNMGAGFLGMAPPNANFEHSKQYVAFASYEKIDNIYSINVNNIEMSMGVYTFNNHPFSSHMGISRTPFSIIMQKELHENLAIKLHAFAANCILSEDSTREYMVNTPTDFMMQYFYDTYKKQNKLSELIILFEPDENYIPYLKRFAGAQFKRFDYNKYNLKIDEWIFNPHMSTSNKFLSSLLPVC